MKAILFDRLAEGGGVTDAPAYRLVPDSALTVTGQPVFLPAIRSLWEARAYPAVRIGRLGKGIAPKFASRYVDAVTLAVLAVPHTYQLSMAEHGITTSLTWTFDGALTTGKWLPYSPDTPEFTLQVGDIEATFTADELRLNDCIAAASAMMTLKTGDVILPPPHSPGIPIAVGDTLPCSLSGHPVLTFKVR